MKVTAAQLKHFDEINIDKRAAKETLSVAIAFHSNRINEIYTEEAALWNELIEIHSLDPDKQWTISRKCGALYTVEKED